MALIESYGNCPCMKMAGIEWIREHASRAMFYHCNFTSNGITLMQHRDENGSPASDDFDECFRVENGDDIVKIGNYKECVDKFIALIFGQEYIDLVDKNEHSH